MKKYLTVTLLTIMLSLSSSSTPEVMVLKAGHSANIDEPYHLGLLELARIVNEKSDGRVQIEIYPNNQLGNERQMIEGLLLGTLDITVPSNGVLTNFVKELGILDLPFLFNSRQHMYTVLDGPVGENLKNSMAHRGFQLLGYYEAGVRHIMTRSKAINSFEDLEGLKVRTMAVPEHIASFNAFGANGVPLAYGELYGALQTGLVDGAEAANTNYNSKKFYEVAPYWAQIGWTTLVANLIMSKERFEALPIDVQKILLEAGNESALRERQIYADSDTKLFEVLKDKGVRITYPDPEPFRQASLIVYEDYIKTEEDQELLNAILSMK